MATVRCYLPLSLEQLRTLGSTRALPGPLPASTVTESVRSAHPSGDQEEWEYAALQAAAQGQLTEGEPVVVAAVDLVRSAVDAEAPEGPRVQVGDVDLPRVAALHVGDDVVTGDRTTLPAADEEIELSWYDTTELAHVVELVTALVEGPPD